MEDSGELQFGTMKGRRMPDDRVRVLRLLEYEGPREWIEATLSANTVKGTRKFGNGCFIREGTIGAFPVVIEEPREVEQLTDNEIKFMRRFGWELNTRPAVKHEIQTGKVLAHEGDEVWIRDLKVAGE